jgi:hypothetical protein
MNNKPEKSLYLFFPFLGYYFEGTTGFAYLTTVGIVTQYNKLNQSKEYKNLVTALAID